MSVGQPCAGLSMLSEAPEAVQFVPLFNFPEVLRSVPCVLGIDEAGRGPVLGPLVYSIFVCPVASEPKLKAFGVDDSKVLDVASREAFARKIALEQADQMGWFVKIVTPEQISACMLRRQKYNLNSLSYDTVYSLLERIKQEGVNVQHVYVDTLGKPETYKKQLTDRFPRFEFTVSSKADSIYPVVGAASVFAKVTRDWNLEKWQPARGGRTLHFDRNFGSGYPSDPSTVEWLKRNMDKVFGFPEIVRFSWSSCTRILEELAVAVNWNEPAADEDEEAERGRSAGKKRKGVQGTIAPLKPLSTRSHGALALFKVRAVSLGDL